MAEDAGVCFVRLVSVFAMLMTLEVSVLCPSGDSLKDPKACQWLVMIP